MGDKGKKLIVIDSGHGGSAPGAVAGGIEEADVNLDTAFVLQKALLKAGFDVALTRTADVYVPNYDRATFCNRHGGDAYIALHCNAGPPPAHGWEVLHGNGCPGGKRLAEFLALGLHDLPVPGRTNEVKAEAEVGRGKSFRLSVLHNTRAPAALIEMGFITNPFDRAFLVSVAGKDKIARAITDGLLKYFAAFV